MKRTSRLWESTQEGWEKLCVTSFIESRDGTVYECKTLAEFRETMKSVGVRNILKSWKISREEI